MKTLLKRLAPLCLCATAALTFASTAAEAGGNGSLFSSNAGIFGAASNAMDLPRSKPLLYTDAEPVKVENLVVDEDSDTPGPSCFWPAAATSSANRTSAACPRRCITKPVAKAPVARPPLPR